MNPSVCRFLIIGDECNYLLRVGQVGSIVYLEYKCFQSILQVSHDGRRVQLPAAGGAGAGAAA